MPLPDPRRRQSIELLRIVAAFGIVWFHLQAPGSIRGLLSLPLILILAGAPSIGSVGRRGGAFIW